MQHVRVQLGERSYDALIGGGATENLPALLRGNLRQPVSGFCIISDNALAQQAAAVRAKLVESGSSAALLTLHASENGKSLDTLSTLLHELCASTTPRYDRDSVIIAIGGGVVGDLAGFAAATFKRGVRWVNIPTTLLAMVDASVGGKTGANVVIDAVLHKNAIGAFHQPSLVVIDTDWLVTLPPRHYRSGLAECIKHAMLCRSVPGHADTSLFDDTAGFIECGAGSISEKLTDLIARNIALKARVVALDEREAAPDDDSGRALLNLGHTFAHVIEGLELGHPRLLHGEAVALGLIAASHTARAMNRVGDRFVRTIEELVHAAGLPVQIRELPEHGSLIRRMRTDKKSRSGRLRVILPIEEPGASFGRASVVTDPSEGAVGAGWDSIRA